MIKLKVL